jgi:L-lactate dehydrogenase complex protein LldG
MKYHTSRQQIMSNIQCALGREKIDDSMQVLLNLHLEEKPRGILPALSDTALTIFIEKIRKSSVIVEQIHSISDSIFLLEKIVKNNQLDPRFRLAGDPLLKLIPFSNHPHWTLQWGAADQADRISVTSAFCGIAETGTLVLLSSELSPTTLNFLPPIHVVLLDINQIVPHYEDAFDLINQAYPSSQLPRTINFISGPSRTSDIEQTAQFGAHGPKQLYVLLFQEEK